MNYQLHDDCCSNYYRINILKQIGVYQSYDTIHWVKSIGIWSYSGPHFPIFGLNKERCGKIQTRINPNTDTFYAVIRNSKDNTSSI